MMKITLTALLSLQAATSASAFTVVVPAAVTRPASSLQGKPGAASSAEEDLMLTLKVIMDHAARSTTATKDQFISQMEESKKVDEAAETAEPVDISIPYDAAAKLAFEASDKSMAYDAFKEKYEADAVADVIAKNAPAVDISVPYDAAAKLAYEASDKSMAYDAFKTKFEADAVADVIAKKAPDASKEAPAVATAASDISVPYDAAAKLAYEASDKSMAYDAFKAKFEADAVADVIAKKAPAEAKEAPAAAAAADISVPYDAAAKLAYEASDKSMAYDAFKTKFEADAVKDVIAKQTKTEPVAA